MFRPREHVESGYGFGGGHGGVAPLVRAPARHTRRARLETWIARHSPFCDLAEDIGSIAWQRGLAATLGLAGLALCFWPDFAVVEPAQAMPVLSEWRSQTIKPLALGADSGRRARAGPALRSLGAAPERAALNIVATLGQGDSFAAMLVRAGVGTDDASRAAQLAGSQVRLSQIAPGTQVDITLGKHEPGGPRQLDKLSFRARFDLDLAVERQGGALTVIAHPLAVDATPLRIRGAIGASLYRSARASGAPVMAIQQYLQALDPHISLEGDIAPGDMFDIIVAHKRSASGQSETGQLLYAGLERAGKPIATLLRWGAGGQMLESAGWGMPQRSGLAAPVNNAHITSGYGMRYHPILGYARMHAGIDFGVRYGAPIFAVGDGIVAFAGVHGGHGNYVRLEHGDGLGTGYGHMSRIAVSPGMRVHSGEVIGYVGSTGLSTGPHLHYEVYRNGQTINPGSVNFTVTTHVDAGEQAAFKARLAQLRAIKVAGVPLSYPGYAAPVAVDKPVEREID